MRRELTDVEKARLAESSYKNPSKQDLIELGLPSFGTRSSFNSMTGIVDGVIARKYTT